MIEYVTLLAHCFCVVLFYMNLICQMTPIVYLHDDLCDKCVVIAWFHVLVK